jgi:redox-regulated HSP33 family molecular chaperone
MPNHECEYCDYTTESEHGLDTHMGMKHPHELPYNNPEILKRLYWQEGLNIREISNKMNCHMDRVGDSMRELGIERRNHPEAILNAYERNPWND